MKQILLVDDDPNLLASLRRQFRPHRRDWALTTAGGGNQAMALVRKHPFDLVITDILMPEGEGFETIMKLRRGYPWVKIVAISGGGRHVGKDVLRTAQGLGAHKTLEKPFDPQTLVDAVRALLRMSSDDTPIS